MSIERYISKLAISAERAPAIGRVVIKGGVRKKGAAEKDAKSPKLPDKLDAAVNAGSILSFVDGVEPAARTDILYSVQLAQRAANQAYDRFAEMRSWYGKYNEVLEAVGWTTEHYAFTAHGQAEGNLRMDKAALAVIGAIAVGNQLAAITKSIEALGKLADSDGAITIFDYNAAADLSGNFQIGAVQQGATGTLSMALGAFYFRANAKRRKFLFFQWGQNEVNFWTAAQKMTFNSSIYASVRDAVAKKLGQSAVDQIKALAID